jgi:hypothetical protein
MDTRPYIICFYWKGDRWQDTNYKNPAGHINKQLYHLQRIGTITDKLVTRYVQNLYDGCKRYADRDFRFVCFTNEKLGKLSKEIELRPVNIVTIDGVLPRMYMFSKEAGLHGHQVLCLDLDVLITGTLKPLLDYQGMFCTRQNFMFCKKGVYDEGFKLDGDIMSFYAGEENEKRFWKALIKDIPAAEELTQGRERYWVRHVLHDVADTWDVLCPGRVVSYKHHAQYHRQALPVSMSVVSCHGKPRPHQIKSIWIKQYWQ